MNLYLDWAAAAIPETRLILRETQQACTLFANPSAVHCLGNDARDALERARHTCAQSLGINPERLIFTSGGSEANQLTLLSVLTRLPHAEISVSMLEHASVTALLPRLERLQVSVRHIPVNARGFITPEAVRATLSPRTTLVCVSAVHSETGAIQPLPAIAHVLAHTGTRGRSIQLHVDAAQAFGKIPLNLYMDLPRIEEHAQENNAPQTPPGYPAPTAQRALTYSVAISGHKIGAPRGIGLLCAHRSFTPFVLGGGQEKERRPGTENLAGALALAACVREGAFFRTLHTTPEGPTPHTKPTAPAGLRSVRARTCAFVRALSDLPRVQLVPATRKEDEAHFSPYIVCCAVQDASGEALVRAFSDAGVCISTGSACSTKKGGVSTRLLRALGVESRATRGVLRFSFGPHTTAEDLDRVLTLFRTLLQKL